jgi:single-stranded DNA-binding protein
LAEVAGQYLKKGGLVYIEGRIQSRKYTGKDGIERTAYEIIGSEMKMLGGGNDSGQQNAQHTPPAPPRSQAPAAPAQPVDDIDDDVPF